MLLKRYPRPPLDTIIGGLQPVSRDTETQITMLQGTTAGGRTRGANEKSFAFVYQHGSYDVT